MITNHYDEAEKNKRKVQMMKQKINVLQATAIAIRNDMQYMNSVITTEKPSIWESISFLLKNKFGLTKDAAKKMFFDYKNKGKEPDDEDPKQPESIDEKMNAIMGYMKETSQKLENIENDINYLKDQVELILKKL